MTSPNTLQRRLSSTVCVATMKIIFAYNYSELAKINNKTPVPEFISYKLERFFFLPMKQYFRWNLLKVNAIFLYKNARYQ